MIHETFEELQQTLDSLQQTYEELLGIAKTKQHHLVKNDILQLREDLTVEEPLVRRIDELESERQILHRKCCRLLRLTPEPSRLEELLPYVREHNRQALRMSRDRLAQTVAMLNDVNSINTALIHASLDVVEGSLQAMFGVGPPVSAYDAHGARTSAIGSASSFIAMA